MQPVSEWLYCCIIPAFTLHNMTFIELAGVPLSLFTYCGSAIDKNVSIIHEMSEQRLIHACICTGTGSLISGFVRLLICSEKWTPQQIKIKRMNTDKSEADLHIVDDFLSLTRKLNSQCKNPHFCQTLGPLSVILSFIFPFIPQFPP